MDLKRQDTRVGHDSAGGALESLLSSGITENESRMQSNHGDGLDIKYRVEDVPRWYLTIILALQQYLTMISGTAVMPILIAPALCLAIDTVALTEITGTLFFVSAIVTFAQSTFGVRLPIIQGGTITFLVSINAILSLPKWKCPDAQDAGDLINLTHNATMEDPDWRMRMRVLQGSLITASAVELLIGAFGLAGWLLKYIGPLTIAPTISLIGISLFDTCAGICSTNWAIAMLTIFLVAVFSQCMGRVEIPFFFWNKKQQKWVKVAYPVFTMFPVFLGISLSWLFCYILTLTNAFPDDKKSEWYLARTDVKIQAISNAKWFRFPYPFQWGMPIFTVEGFLGMLAGVLAGTMESIGDYYACARLSGAPPPPEHAVNRGILIEGIGGVLSGMWGSGTGTSSFSENVGAIGITKVGSRRVIQAASCIMLILALFGKFGAIFITIPDPIIGGILVSMFSMVIAVGVSNLQFVNLNNSRNMYIFGFSIMFGLVLPQWLGNNPGIIQTGVVVIDQILSVLLTSSMFVGGFLGFLLDNIFPGSRADRGLDRLKESSASSGDQLVRDTGECYDFPCNKCQDHLHESSCARRVPFCPGFTGFQSCECCRRHRFSELYVM